MAKKRMLSLQIVDTDAFLDMPLSTQALYFHLVMRADDEGFISNPKRIMRLIGCQDDDLKILIGKRFILTFESGVVVIKHWLIHNTIRMDRFNETVYLEEKNSLIVKKNRGYTENGNQMATTGKHKLSKVKLSKVNIDIQATPVKVKKLTIIQEIVEYFFSIKGWENQKPSFSRYVRDAKDLAELANQDLDIIKKKINEISTWADENGLSWNLGTIIKRWQEQGGKTEQENLEDINNKIKLINQNYAKRNT